VANVIAAWAERYLDQPEVMTEEQVLEGLVLVRETHGAIPAGDFDRAAPPVADDRSSSRSR